MSLARKALETVGFRVAGLPISFAMTVITSRFLLPEGRGAFVLGLLTVTLAATLLGNGSAVTHEIGKGERTADVLQHALVLSALLGIVAAAALIPLDRTLSTTHSFAISLFPLGLAAMLVVQTIGGALLALGRVRLWNALQFLSPAATLIGIALLVVALSKGVTGAVVAWLVAQWLTAAAALALTTTLWARKEFRRLSFNKMGPFAVLGLKVGLINLTALVNYRIELFLIELYRGLGAVGVYSVAVSLAELLWLLSAAISTAALAPALQRDSDEAVNVVTRATRHALLLTALAGIGLAGVSVLAIPAVFGNPFRGAYWPLVILIPGAVAWAPMSVISNYFSMRLGRMRYPLSVAAFSATTTALLCLLLIPSFGIRGAALASTVGYASAACLQLFYFLRSTHSRIRDVVPQSSDLAAYRGLSERLLRRRRVRGGHFR